MKRGSGKQVSIQEVVSRTLEGEAEAVEALRQTATYLGRGLLAVIYSLNPEVVTLGGPTACLD